jgi:phosphohistidine phosphatase SixA
MKRRTMLQALVPVPWAAACGLGRADDKLWPLLQRGGQVVLVRHGLTDPGVGDPPSFRLGDCSTQRNLNEQGRGKARRLGEALRTQHVPVGAVLASPWCRCIETARLAFGREPQVHAALSNLFGRPEREDAQVAQLKQLVRARSDGNLFLVSHGSTTLALTGVSPATAEMVVLTPAADGSFQVAGRLAAR